MSIQRNTRTGQHFKAPRLPRSRTSSPQTRHSSPRASSASATSAPHIPRPINHPRAEFHHAERTRSHKILQDARDKAAKDREYNSAATRQKLSQICEEKTGLVPYAEQLDLAECILLGVDSTSMAGTGWGKTLPFALPMFLLDGKVTVIISPLNALESDQAERFRKMGLSAVALNGDTISEKLERDIEAGVYQIVLVGPKMCIEKDGRFRTILAIPRFAKRVASLIIDEAHCITLWGDSFRTEYAELGTLRALLPLHVPVHLTSATLSPDALALARKSLHISCEQSFHLNLGNDRPNIAWEVRRMTAGKSDLDALAFLIPEDVEHRSNLPKTMIFFDDIVLLMKARRWFIERLPKCLQHRIGAYHARLSRLGKDLSMELFRRGHVDVLFTTEAAGMGCDIPDVELVVQFMVPSSLSVWIQRAGRAGRRKDISARAILLVQPTVFQEKGKQKRGDSDPITYVKEIEDGLRQWLEVPRSRCRRDVVDAYFDSPPRCIAPTGLCCDNCAERPSSITQPQAAPASAPVTMSMSSGPVHDTTCDATDDATDVAQDVTQETESSEFLGPYEVLSFPITRRDDHLAEVRQVLTQWRLNVWRARYRTCPFGVQGILPDSILTALATRTTYQMHGDVSDLMWLFADEHARDALQEVREVDVRRTREKLAAEREKREADVEERASRRRAREEEVARVREGERLRREELKRIRDEQRQKEKVEKARVRKEEAARRKAEKMAKQDASRKRKADEELVLPSAEASTNSKPRPKPRPAYRGASSGPLLSANISNIVRNTVPSEVVNG